MLISGNSDSQQVEIPSSTAHINAANPVEANWNLGFESDCHFCVQKSASVLPSLHTILDMRVSTFHHVLKGATDAWADLVGAAC